MPYSSIMNCLKCYRQYLIFTDLPFARAGNFSYTKKYAGILNLASLVLRNSRIPASSNTYPSFRITAAATASPKTSSSKGCCSGGAVLVSVRVLNLNVYAFNLSEIAPVTMPHKFGAEFRRVNHPQ